MSEPILSPATPGDAYWAAGQEFAHLPEVDPAFAPAQMSRLRRMVLRHLVLPLNYHRKLEGYLLKREQERLGYLFLRQVANSLHVESIAVEPPHRRQGFGRRLLAQAARLTQERGLDYLSAALTPQNIPAQALFASQGFFTYRPQGWQKEGGVEVTPTDSAAIQEISPRDLIAAHQTWQARALEQGEAGVKDLVLAAYPRATLRTSARHWLCLLEGKPAGYLRIAGLLGEMEVYLASEASTWRHPAQLEWLAAALANYPRPPRRLLADLASGGHYAASRTMWSAAGFSLWQRPRYLVWKRMTHKAGDLEPPE
jgi:GNAT superfamily N-acetyltransferase